MSQFEQGDIIKVDGITDPAIVASKNYFNQTGGVIVCPILKESSESPLHIFVHGMRTEGFVQCEKLKLLDARARRCRQIDRIPMSEVMDITDAIQAIFDYV